MNMDLKHWLACSITDLPLFQCGTVHGRIRHIASNGVVGPAQEKKKSGVSGSSYSSVDPIIRSVSFSVLGKVAGNLNIV